MDEQPLNIVLLNDPQQLVFCGKDAAPITLTIKNEDTREAVEVRVNIVRGDLLKPADLTLTQDELIGGGYKVIDEGWLECRLNSLSSWVAVDEWDNYLDLGSLPAGDSVSFDVRLNVPSNNTDNGRMCFAIMISSKPETQPQIRGVTIDQTGYDIYLTETETATASVVAEPGADTAVQWTCSNPAVATVDISSGVITAVGSGRAVIKAASNQNQRFYSTRYVRCSEPDYVAGASLILDSSELDSIIVSPATYVTEWRDLSGNDNHLYAEPSYKPRTGQQTLNSKNVISFTNSRMQTAFNVFDTGVNKPYTIFVVAKSSAVHDTIFFSGTAWASNGCLLAFTEPDNNMSHSWWGNDFVTPNGTWNYTDHHILMMSWDGSNERITVIDDNDFTGTGSGKDLTDGKLSLGFIKDFYGFDYELTGSIASVVVYNRLLNSSEIAQTKLKLKLKWGL
ncbi:MAG: Bacterial Ig-like domain (group 2) [Parcubacteria group bacterium ADurb.Bin192]|nr:MAG: Bacterial Ig-like domain (group 2) [Parcubacteria group bacterium ADurb.Bin192]